MLTTLGKFVALGIIAFIFCTILIATSGCTFLPAIDAALGTIVPTQPTHGVEIPLTDTKQYVFSGLVTLALGAIAIYVRNVKKNGATKKDLDDLKKDPASSI